MRKLGFVLCLTVAMVACGDEPTGPTPAPVASTPTTTPAPLGPPTPARPSARVNGNAYDTAARQVSGARVEVLDGPLAGTATTTNDVGNFSIAGSFDDSVRFRVSKPGYVAKIQTSRIPDCATCERYVGFLMELEAAPVDLTGNYVLTFTAAPSCAGMPEDALTRSYNATITRDRALAWSFDVTIASGSILRGHASDGVKFGVAGHDVVLGVGDLHGSPGLVEQLTADTYVSFDGSASGSAAPSFSSLSLPFAGLVEYCRLPAGSPAPVGGDNYYACTAGRVACVSQGHRVTLSRR